MRTLKKYILCYFELKKLGEVQLSNEIKLKALEISNYNHLVRCVTSDVKNIDLFLK